MSGRRVTAPTQAAALRALRDDVRELQRVPGRWIYVGTYPTDAGTLPESPPFQNGWMNKGSGFVPCRFKVNKWRDVEIEGGIEGGAVGSVIFTLPEEYRPDGSLRFVCSSDGTATTHVQVDPNGDVTQVS